MIGPSASLRPAPRQPAAPSRRAAPLRAGRAVPGPGPVATPGPVAVPGSIGVLGVLGVLAAALMLGSPPVEAQQGARDVPLDETSRLRGVVLDLTTGGPILEAAVRLHFPDGRPPLTRMTDEDGRFIFPPLVPGSYGIELFRLGYSPVRDSLSIERGSEMDVVAELAPDAIELPAVVVATSRRSRLETNGFYQRRETMVGRFIARPEIEERRPTHLSDLFRMIPSLRLTPLPQGQGSAVLGRGGCRPTYFLDGVRMLDSASLDNFVHPDDLDGVEVYGSAGAPPQYQGSRCGSIVLWTRTPTPGQGRGSVWKKALVAASFVGGVLLIAR